MFVKKIAPFAARVLLTPGWETSARHNAESFFPESTDAWIFYR